MTKGEDVVTDKEKNKKKLSIGTAIKNNIYILKFMYRLSPSYLTVTMISKIFFSCAYSVINVYFVKIIIDMVSAKKEFRQILTFFIIQAIVYIVLMLLNNGHYMYNTVKSNEVRGKLQRVLFGKALETDLIYYDNPEFYNEYVKAGEQADTNVMQCMETTATALSNIISMLLIGGIIISVDPVIALFPLLSFIISIVIQVVINKILYKYDMEKSVVNRKGMYSKRVFYQAEYAKELKMTNVSAPLKSQFESTIKELRDLADQYGFKLASLYLLYWIFSYTFFSFFCTPIYLAWGVLVAKTISIGDMASMTNASNSVRRNLLTLNQTFAKIHTMGLYSQNFKAFIENESEIENRNSSFALPDKPGKLNIKHLCFRYAPESEFVLHDINIEIEAGEKIAIVGYNGAGKSTLIKLILNLYRPDSGSILYNGIDIAEYNTENYRQQFAVIFQDYQMFAATVKENVVMGYVDAKDEAVYESLQNSGLRKRIEHLPNRIENQIYKEFDVEGTVLSGGESQKLAMARIFYSKAPLIIMDEPSSALDPIAEYEVNKNIFEHAVDKTVIFISHRLSTTRFVDKIYMFDSGIVIEEGSHEELMDLDGKYAAMYLAQAEKYQLSETAIS